MPLDLELLPDKPQTVRKGGFSLDLESLPDKPSSFNINLDLLPDRPGTKLDLHWIGEGIRGTIADITAMPYRALGIRAPVEGVFFSNVKSIGEWVNEPIGYKKEMMPDRIVTPLTDRSKVKWQEKEIPISRGTVLTEAGVNIAALALLGKIGYDELRNIIQTPQVQLGLSRLVTEGRGIVWRAQKLVGMQPPSALIPVEDSQIAQALKEGRMSYFDAMRVSPSLRQKEIAIRQPGTPEFIARQQTVSREFNIPSEAPKPSVLPPQVQSSEVITPKPTIIPPVAPIAPVAPIIPEPKLDITQLPDKPVGEGKVAQPKVAPALKTADGKVYVGTDHGDILNKLAEEGIIDEADLGKTGTISGWRVQGTKEFLDEKYLLVKKGEKQPSIMEALEKQRQELSTPIGVEAEIKRVGENILKNNPGITQKDAEAMAKDVIANRKFTQPTGEGKVELFDKSKIEVKEAFLPKGEYIHVDRASIEDYISGKGKLKIYTGVNSGYSELKPNIQEKLIQHEFGHSQYFKLDKVTQEKFDKLGLDDQDFANGYVLFNANRSLPKDKVISEQMQRAFKAKDFISKLSTPAEQKPKQYVEVKLSDEDKTILEQIKKDMIGTQPGHKYVTRDEEGNVVATGYEPSDYAYIPYWPKGWSGKPINTITDNAVNKGKLTIKQKEKLDTLLSMYKEVTDEQTKLEQELSAEGIGKSEIDEVKRAGEEEAHSIVEPSEGNITPSGQIREELHAPLVKDLFQEEGELFAQAKGKGAGKAFAMPPGGLEEWIKRTQEQDIQLRPLEMPELVKLAVDLMGKYPVVKKLVTNLGLFKFGKGIALDVKIFKNPQIAGIVLAHEIGHLIDWLPDYTVARGNILGRIATLRKYMKSLLAEKPGMEGTVLTQKDRDRLRRVAEVELKAEVKLGEREIIEEIIKEIPIYAESKITPDEILSIWRESATAIRETNPTLYNFISGLSSTEKKSIIKQALQGIIDERIMQMAGGKRVGTKIVKEQVRRVITPVEITPQNISRRFKQLLKEEIIKRKLFSREMITEELKRVTQWWNPFDDTRKGWFTNYRYGSDELYAEAISVLLNKPEKLEELAPQFYKAFWNYIDRKPEVKKALLELQDFLNMGEGEKLRVRQQDIYSMFKKGEELFYDKRKEYELRKKSIWFRLRAELIDKNTALLDKIKEAEKQGRTINPEDNPKYYLEEYNYIGGKIKNLLGDIDDTIIKPLETQGITQENIGEYLFLNRVLTERGDIANPLGHNRETAQRQLEYLHSLLGGEKFDLLKQSVDKFQGIMKGLLLEAEKVGLYKPEVIKELITNPAYATFQVLDYLDDYVAPSIINQIGTLKPIANPFASTILKMISTMRAIERIKTNNSVITFLSTNFPKEITGAKVRHIGKYKAEIVEKEGFEIIKTREGGKLAGYYVDPYIAQSVNSSPRNINNAVVSVLRFFNSNYFRPVYVNLNLGFQTFNAIRDFTRAWKLNPNVNFATALGYYWKALPIAKQRIWGNFTDPVIKEMQQYGMLSFTYNNLMRGVSEGEETQVEFLLRQFDILKKNPQNPVMKVFNFIEELGDFIETIPKVAGYLSRLKSKQNIKEIAHQVRVFSGSPDFLRKGAGYDWYNNAFLFSNAIKEGIRGDIEGAFKNPKTRSGYWWRTAKVNFITKILMILGGAGYFGLKIKENFDKQTEYDKTNYTTIPLGMSEEGKAIYLRVPQDEMGRLLGGIFWKGMNGVVNRELKSGQDIGGLLGGQLPSMSPEIELLSSWAQYLIGKNPYDWFRGREILSDDEQMAGGWYSLKPMIGWTAGKLGMYGATIKVQNDETTWEKVIKFTPIVQRFLRITDYGETEIRREERQERGKAKAIRRLERRKLR